MAVTAIIRTGAVAAALLLLAGCSWTRVDPEPYPATARSFTAPMNAAQEVPGTNSGGTGAVYATLHPDGMLRWYVAYAGLTGQATSAYFYGPAGHGAGAARVVNIGALGVAPLMRGEAHLNDAQIADLVSGLWYASVQTHAYPNGEIRGQLVFTP